MENGYEETTVAQIADRAGLNRATFFRHFADKREVLFGGEDLLAGLFADAIRAAPPGVTLTECLQAALAAVGVVMTPQRRAAAAQRVLVVAANNELQERGLLKHARIARSITAALRERGTEGKKPTHELIHRLHAEHQERQEAIHRMLSENHRHAGSIDADELAHPEIGTRIRHRSTPSSQPTRPFQEV